MTKALLFLSSLVPLIFIVSIRLFDDALLWSLGLAVVSIIGAVSLPVVFFVRRSVGSRPFEVKEVRDESHQVPAYLLTYIFPLLFVTIDDWDTAAAYAVFAALLIVLMVRTDLALVNPLLLAFGYHLFALRNSTGQEIFLVSRLRPLVGSNILVKQLSGSLNKLDQVLT